jgi:hypothetical protein
MTDYGKGMIVSSATVLPATAAFGIFATQTANGWVTVGFFIFNTIWLVLLLSYISRYLFNRNA